MVLLPEIFSPARTIRAVCLFSTAFSILPVNPTVSFRINVEGFLNKPQVCVGWKASVARS